MLAMEQPRCCLHVNVTASGCPSLAAPLFFELNRRPAQAAAEVGTCIWQHSAHTGCASWGCLDMPHTLWQHVGL